MLKSLNIDLMSMTDEEFTKERLKYIKEYVSDFGWTKDKAEVTFDEKYPNKEEWKAQNTALNARGEQRVINKINEIIDFLNKLDKSDLQELRAMLEASDEQ